MGNLPCYRHDSLSTNLDGRSHHTSKASAHPMHWCRWSSPSLFQRCDSHLHHPQYTPAPKDHMATATSHHWATDTRLVCNQLQIPQRWSLCVIKWGLEIDYRAMCSSNGVPCCQRRLRQPQTHLGADESHGKTCKISQHCRSHEANWRSKEQGIRIQSSDVRRKTWRMSSPFFNARRTSFISISWVHS